MKIRSTFHFFALVMAVLTFSMPIVTLAQQGSLAAEAVAAAEADAEADVNKPLWFAAGCVAPGLGTIASYVVEPTPPAGRLMGKSPEYVASYTDAYKAKSKSIQTRTALIGCAVGCGVSAAAYILVVGAALASETSEPVYYYDY